MLSIFRIAVFILLLTAFVIPGAVAQNQIIELWPDGAPGAISNPAYIEGLASDKPNRILRVSNPTLTIYLPDRSENTGTAVLILPGGGYRRLAMDIEGYDVAEWLNSIGIAAFLLKYRLPNDSIMVDKKVGPLQDAQEAMRLIRRQAGKWSINKEKIGVIGFSAGGHLAATLATRYADPVYKPVDQVSARPDFAILVYPVISMDSAITHSGSRRHLLGNNPSEDLVTLYSNELQVNKTTPPTFILHAANDKSVQPENSIRYYQALQQNSVKSEIHIYQQGGHGFGLAKNRASESMWTKNCHAWLKSIGII